jgi:hypothetical protein
MPPVEKPRKPVEIHLNPREILPFVAFLRQAGQNPKPRWQQS